MPEPPTAPAPVGPNSESVTITADGSNTYAGEMATADDNVILRYRDTVIFADHMIYDRATKVATATGNVRIFAGQKVYRGDSITYNLDTKAITSSSFLAGEYPKFLSAKTVTTPEFNHYRLTNASFTTSNREKPSFHLQASTVEYRPDDEVVLKNVVLYVGAVPVFYFPVIVQSLTDSRPVYQFSIGSSDRFGAFIDNKYNWVASDKIRGSTEFDVREKRGYAGGVDVQYFPAKNSDILLKTYYAQDNLYALNYNNAPSNGNINDPNVFDGVPYDNRYRVTYQHHLQFSDDLSSLADLNLWSDPWVTRDFFTGEYPSENQPANVVALTQYNSNFTIGLLVMPQVNPFFETVERLPEFTVDSKQQKIFGSGVEWASQNSVVNFQRHYAETGTFRDPSAYIYNSFPANINSLAYTYYHPNAAYGYNTAQDSNYSAYRYDTFQQFSYPKQYFNFLSLEPRIGGRFTAYSDNNSNIGDTVNNNGQADNMINNPVMRVAGEVGMSGSFKVSRTWTDVSVPNLGINGLRHVAEPFFDAQYAPSPTVTPNNIRGFDDRLYSTQLQPINWLDYNSIDSIDRQAVVRFGITNSLQTKRDGANADLITWKTYLDADFDRNFSSATPNTTLSNLFNEIHYNITPQFQFQSESALDITGSSYNQIDNSIVWSPDASLKASLGYHYINHSLIIPDGNNVNMTLFYRMNEHWQFQAQEQFEATTGQLQYQQYTVFRDLDSWQLAMTYADAQINGVHNQSIFFSLTLKALPQYQLHTPRF